jgi:hypothetical protein
MPFKMIAVSIRDPGQAEEEWNAFLRSHRVLSVERRFAEDGASSFWCFCIDYLDKDGSSRGGAAAFPIRARAPARAEQQPSSLALGLG